MSKIHVWAGTTPDSLEIYSRYFEVDQVQRALHRPASPFDTDLGTFWYDDDLIGVCCFEEPRPIGQAVDELPVLPDILDVVLRKCLELNIGEVNALFYYTDATLNVDPLSIYNGLTYLGVFDND